MAFGIIELAIVLFASVIVSYILSFLFEAIGKLLVGRTKTTLDDRLFEALRAPLKWLFYAIGLYLGIQYFSPSFQMFGKNAFELLGLSLILIITFIVSNLVNAFFKWYFTEATEESHLKSKIKMGRDIYPIVRWTASLFIYLIALFIFFNRLGIDLSPLLAIPTILSLGVGLALQDTLKNFFAGVYLLSNHPIKVGDLVSLDTEASSVKGTVLEITWRTTKILAITNNVLVIPNDMVTNSVLVNFGNVQDSVKKIKIDVGVSFDARPELVEKTLKACLKEISKEFQGVDKSFKPVVFLSAFGDSAVTYTLQFQYKGEVITSAVESALRKEILKEFKKNGIEIPFPIKTVHIKTDN